jgi:hypothetical protein
MTILQTTGRWSLIANIKCFTSFYDNDIKDFIGIPVSMLEQEVVVEVCVDSASLLICDPMYLKMDDEYE